MKEWKGHHFKTKVFQIRFRFFIQTLKGIDFWISLCQIYNKTQFNWSDLLKEYVYITNLCDHNKIKPGNCINNLLHPASHDALISE